MAHTYMQKISSLQKKVYGIKKTVTHEKDGLTDLSVDSLNVIDKIAQLGQPLLGLHFLRQKFLRFTKPQ